MVLCLMGLITTYFLKFNDGAYITMKLYREAIGKGVKIRNYTASVLLNGLYKERKVKKVENVMISLVEHELISNMVIYNTFVNGYCQIVIYNTLMNSFGGYVIIRLKKVAILNGFDHLCFCHAK